MRATQAKVAMFQLPPPISTNELFIAFNRGGKAARVKSQKYIAWRAAAGVMLEKQNPPHVAGHYGMRISVPAKTRMDLSNSIKAIEDLCVDHKVIIDDRYCENISIERGQGDLTTVWIISTNKKTGKNDNE